jgi:stage III sporulation protein AC
MELPAKIFAIGILLCVTDIILSKSGKNDVAFWLSLAGLALIMAMVVPQISQLFKNVLTMFNL